MKEASFSLAEAKFATGNFSHIVLQNVNKAQIKVRSKNDNVAGEMFGLVPSLANVPNFSGVLFRFRSDQQLKQVFLLSLYRCFFANLRTLHRWC